LDIQRATELRTSGICPRVGPLGTDKDGRVYWVLSPGMAERESAEDLLRAVVDKGANRRPMRGQNASPLAFRRLAAPTEAERTRLTRWSWFVAVWGTRPDDASMIRTEDDEDEDEDENADERWWCFWKPEDIEALADWLAFTHRTDGTHTWFCATLTHVLTTQQMRRDAMRMTLRPRPAANPRTQSLSTTSVNSESSSHGGSRERTH
jgi:hypothetical protein